MAPQINQDSSNMSLTTPLLSSIQSPPRNCCTRVTNRCKESFALMGTKLRRFTLIFGTYLSTTLSGLYLQRRVENNFAKQLDDYENGYLIGMNFVGLVYVIYNLDFIKNLLQMAYVGLKSKHRKVTCLTIAKLGESTSNFAMLIVSTTAACDGLKGNYEKQYNLYQSMIWWGIATIVLGTLNSFTYIYLSTKACKVLTSEQIQRNGHLIANRLKRSDHPDAAEVYATMDKDTRLVFLDTLKRYHSDTFFSRIASGIDSVEDRTETHEQLLQTVSNNLHTMKKNFLGQGVLIVIGDALLITEKYKTPTSIVSSIINFSISSLNTGYLTWITCREVMQRNKLITISNESKHSSNVIAIEMSKLEEVANERKNQVSDNEQK